jgi:hypothetical protein
MSAEMRNFMEAYNAVHNNESREEFLSKKDPISEMSLSSLTHADLVDISEDVIESMLKTNTLSECVNIIETLIPESNNVGREQKVDRIIEAFLETFDLILSKSADTRLEEFAKYRRNKAHQESWSERMGQDKRAKKLHERVVAQEKINVKSGLLQMVEGIRDMDPEKGTAERKARLEKKRGMKMDDHPQYKKEEVEVEEAMSSYDRNRKRAAQRAADRNAARAAGKTGVVPGVGYVSPRKERETYVDSAGTTRHKSGAKMEEVENVEELYKGKHGQTDKQYADSRSPGGKMVSGDSKMSGAEYTHGRRVKAANPGMQPDVGGKTKPKSQGKMDAGTKADLMYRKANLKKEEFVSEKKGSKPDYLDFDGDGDEKESMKKALSDKKKKGMKEQLESSGKFSETEILKIIASL